MAADPAITGQIITWALTAGTGTGLAVAAVMGALWKSQKDANTELIDTLKRQALSSETRAIASDTARNLAEKRAGELEMKYGYLKQQWHRAVRALNVAQIRVDPGALVGTVSSPPGPEEPTGVWAVEAERRVNYFIDDSERARQRPLNPENERQERERIDKLSRQYLDDESSR